ncbi:SLAM family member 8-like isoform X1 [Oryctolagus cuniculus]|uniref:SLAM family member 8-like isoform X1 n=1 Tax=Oryctolagus cuniculus TaxID=9986 RepID=UPI003879BD53
MDAQDKGRIHIPGRMWQDGGGMSAQEAGKGRDGGRRRVCENPAAASAGGSCLSGGSRPGSAHHCHLLCLLHAQGGSGQSGAWWVACLLHPECCRAPPLGCGEQMSSVSVNFSPVLASSLSDASSAADQLAGAAMGPCLAAPHLCWASGLLAFLSPLLSICSTLDKSPEARGSGILDSGLHFPVKGTRGGSVSFHVVQHPGWAPGEKLEEISWGFGPESVHRVILLVPSGAASPTWVSLEDKYKPRLHVPNMTSLVIENVTSQDSGQYRAQIRFTGGLLSTQVFCLTVYEPVPAPQILAESPSITSGWCNVTLQCRATGATEQLNVTWESTGPPSELKQGGAPGPANNSWTLAVSLPRSQPNASLTCVVSNQGDQKSATLDLGDVCVPETDSHGQAIACLVQVIRGTLLAVLLILGAGLFLWRTRGRKKKETGRGASP